MAKFPDWYNGEHHHSALKLVTPGQRHRGEDTDLLAQRHALYQAARAQQLTLERPDAQLATAVHGLPQPGETLLPEEPPRRSC